MSSPGVARLARTLDVTPAELPEAVLALDADAAAELAEHVVAGLHAHEEPKLRSLVGLVDRLPSALVVSIAEGRLEPRFAARLAAHLPVASGEALVARLSPAYLAAVAPSIDFERAGALLAALAPAQIAATAVELSSAGRFDTIAAVAGQVHDPALLASLEALDDGAVRAVLAEAPAPVAARLLALLDPGRRGRAAIAGATPTG